MDISNSSIRAINDSRISQLQGQLQVNIANQNIINNQNQNIYPQVHEMSQNIVINQNIPPKILEIDTSKMKSSSCSMICPFCRNLITTKVKKKFNWCSCCFCYCAGICCWLGLQFCRNKSLDCCDAEHSCPICKNKIGNYSACL